jgi:hypothetical protein
MSNPATIQLMAYLTHLIGSLPWVLVMVAGGAVCLRRLSTQPREGWLVGSAIALSMFGAFGIPNIIGLVINNIPGLAASLATGPDSIWIYQLLYRIPSSAAEASAWGLLLYAAFGEGAGPRSKYLARLVPQTDEM